MTTIIAQLSDPHIRVGPDDQGSAAALSAAVEAVLALAPLPDAVLVSGDLADGGTPAEYDRVRELPAPLPMPVHVLPGNHDDLDWGGPYAADCGELRLIACDTTRPGEDDGRLRAPRRVRHARRLRGHDLPEHEPAGAAGDRLARFSIVNEPPAFLVHTADVAHVRPV